MNFQDLETLNKRLTFIKAVISHSLVIRGRTKNEVLASINSLGLDPMFLELPIVYFSQSQIDSLEKN